MLNWRRPTNLGVKDGRLAPCKRSPNCVSSQADPADREHYIAPISFRGAMSDLRGALESMERSTVITAAANYLYAEGDRHWFDLQVSLNRPVAERAQSYSAADVERFIVDRLRLRDRHLRRVERAQFDV